MYWELFKTFSKIGTFTIGGGLAMLPVIESEVVKKKKWISSDEFIDIIAISQSAPGLIAVNVSIFIGYKVKGKMGSLVAAIGSVLPSFIIILLFAAFFTNIKDNQIIDKIFKALRPVVAALILSPMINLTIKSKFNTISIILAIVSLILIAFFHISPIYILITVALYSVITTWFNIRKHITK